MKLTIIDSEGRIINVINVNDGTTPENWTAATGQLAKAWTEGDAIDPAPESIPDSVSPRQLKMWLNHEGLRKTVEAFFASLPDTIESQDAKDYWEYSTEFLRAHPMNLTVGAILGKTSIEIDQAYLAASKL